jgi:hypothetical protein
VREPLRCSRRSSRCCRIDCAPGHVADRHGQALPRRVPPAIREADAASRRARSASDRLRDRSRASTIRAWPRCSPRRCPRSSRRRALRDASQPFDLERSSPDGSRRFLRLRHQQLRRAGDPAGAD